jgi:hypothetical protein
MTAIFRLAAAFVLVAGALPLPSSVLAQDSSIEMLVGRTPPNVR